MVTEAAIPSSGGQERLEKAEERKKRKLAVREVRKQEYKSAQSLKDVISVGNGFDNYVR